MLISRRIRFFCLLLASSFCQLTGRAGEELQPPSGTRVISFPGAASVNELYVGIMGEVARPGTYHVDPASLKLQSVVRRAGGLTANASPTIRIIRDGRARHREVYSDDASTPLFPGDLLIVDAKSETPKYRYARDLPGETSNVQADYQAQRPETVQLALLNVVEYPLVVRLRADEANAPRLIDALGQPAEVLLTSHVITPDTFPRLTSEEAKRAVHLASGSVVVVERQRVQRHRLPAALPRPIESSIELGAQTALNGNPFGQSSELQNLGQQATASLSGSGMTSFPSQQVVPESPQPPLSEEPVPVANPNYQPTVTNKPRIATVPFSGRPHVAKSSSIGTRIETDSETIPPPADVPAAEPLVEEDDTEMTADVESPRSFSIVQGIALFITVGALIAAALFLRHLLEARSLQVVAIEQSLPVEVSSVPQVASVPPVAEAVSLLDRMIRNELPVTTEPIDIPEGLALHGQLASRPILRVDGPQSILKQSSPHFGVIQRSAEPAAVEVQAHVDSAEAPAIRRPHFMAVRESAAVANATTPSASPAAPSIPPANPESPATEELATAPLARALFHLDRGSHS